jgi:hypothetical protein
VWRLVQGRSWAAAGLVGGTLVGTAVLALGGLLLVAVGDFGRCGFTYGCQPTGWAGVAGMLVPAALFLPWGLLRARRVATGRARDNWGHAQRPVPAEARPVWLVAEPGAEATRSIIGEERVGFLAAGTVVMEVRRTGSRVLVTTSDGLSGWLAAECLESTVQPPESREGRS